MDKNSIIDQLVYDSPSGALTYRDVRYVVIRPETIIGFQKTIEKHDLKGARDALFQGGYQGGYLSAKKFKCLNMISKIGSCISGLKILHLPKHTVMQRKAYVI
jgi:hypothetical protein